VSNRLNWVHRPPAMYENTEAWHLYIVNSEGANGWCLAQVTHAVTCWKARIRNREDLERMTFKNADEAKAYAVAIVTLEN